MVSNFLQVSSQRVNTFSRSSNIFQGFKPGESVAVFGAGPVGLMAAYSAVLRGASEVYVVDRVPERLQKAKDIGCTPIDFSKSDAVQQILDLRGG